MTLPPAPPGKKKYLIELGILMEGNKIFPIKHLAVPREEFFNAALHFHSKRMVDVFLQQEAKYETLKIVLGNVSLEQYTEAMYKEGRWN